MTTTENYHNTHTVINCILSLVKSEKKVFICQVKLFLGGVTLLKAFMCNELLKIFFIMYCIMHYIFLEILLTKC